MRSCPRDRINNCLRLSRGDGDDCVTAPANQGGAACFSHTLGQLLNAVKGRLTQPCQRREEVLFIIARCSSEYRHHPFDGSVKEWLLAKYQLFTRRCGGKANPE